MRKDLLIITLHWHRNDLYFGGGGGGAHSISCAIHVQYNSLFNVMYDQANIGGAIAPPAPMVPTPMP